MSTGEVVREELVAESLLTPFAKDAFDREGYCVFPGIAGAEEVMRMREAFENAMGGSGAPIIGKNTGTRHVAELSSEQAGFEHVSTNAKILAAVDHILKQPFRLFQFSGRDPLPGFGQQGLHTDWLPRNPWDLFSIVTALWLLDDFTPVNGATRLIPGSHLLPRLLPKSMQAPEHHHRDERLIAAQAGSVLVFNGHVWHSGTRNQSTGSRRVLQCQFLAR